MPHETDIPFNRQLKNATREIHSISDALVNAKLAFAMSNNDVWAEGLLVFYEVFKFLEEAMERHKGEPLGDMYVEGTKRTEAFEKDLVFYLGENWNQNYEIRESVAKYIAHLNKVERENSDLLIAYVYHLYMGLLSGGQILIKKRSIVEKVKSQSKNKEGSAVTDFGNLNIYSIKKDIVDRINTVVEKLDCKTKVGIIAESKTVFELNNEIIQSIKGTNSVLFRKIVIALGVLLFSYFILIKLKI